MTKLTIVTGAPSPASGVGAEQTLQDLVIDKVDVPQEDPNGPEDHPPGGGTAAMALPSELGDQWARALDAFEKSAEDMSRAARHVQLIRYPLESLARDVATMTKEIGGLRREMLMLRENLTPPISVNTTTSGTTLVQHVGPIDVNANVVPPGLWVRIKSVAWHVAKAVVVALAVWGAMQLVGSWWPSLAELATWIGTR